MRFIRLKEVLALTSLARSTVYKYIAQGLFPKPVSLGGKSVAWVESEIQAWIQARIDERECGRESVPFTHNRDFDRSCRTL